MKTKINKIISIIILFIIICNIASTSLGVNTMHSGNTTDLESMETQEQKDEIGLMEQIGGAVFNVVDWGAGILLYPMKLILAAIGVVGQTVASGVSSVAFVTPEDILFNKVPLLDINFFDFNHSENFVRTLRENVASWYYGMRNLAIIIALCVLIYVGIRMAISTVAEDRARYKEMLVNWLVGFILIFMLQYIIVLTININNGLVEIFSRSIQNDDIGTVFSTYMTSVFAHAFHPTVTVGIGSAIVYIMFVVLTLGFLIMYIKRMITIAFLIVRSPLITVTYSIDKMGNNKSEAVDTWLKEFIWNVLIQVFHCIIYLVFASVALDSLREQTLASSVLAILCLLFITQAENIVKKIFGIQADSIGKLGTSLALVAGSAVAMKNLGTKAVKSAKSNTKTGPQTVPPKKGTADINNSTVNDSNSANSKNTTTQNTSSSVQNKINKFSKTVENMKDKWNSSTIGQKGSRAISGYAKFAKWQVSKGFMVAGATIGGMKDDSMGGAIAGGVAGHAVGDMVVGKMDHVIQKRRVRNAEIKLVDVYDDYQSGKGYDNEQMLRKANAYMNIDLNSEVSKQMSVVERDFAQTLQNLKREYEKAGVQDSSGEVMKTIETIQEKRKVEQQNNNEEKAKDNNNEESGNK